MSQKVKIYRNNEFISVPIENWFNENFSKLPEETLATFNNISKVFRISSLEDYQRIYEQIWIHFNYHKILMKYQELKELKLPFEEDIVKFISFLFGTEYFQLIGNPDLDKWLSAKELNHPHKDIGGKNEGYSLLEAVKYEYGQNAVRHSLLSTLKWLGPQGGS